MTDLNVKHNDTWKQLYRALVDPGVSEPNEAKSARSVARKVMCIVQIARTANRHR